MSLAVHHGHEVPIATRPRSQALNVHAAKTLLMQGLRMILVIGCFTAVVALVIGIRVLAFLPAMHH